MNYQTIQVFIKWESKQRMGVGGGGEKSCCRVSNAKWKWFEHKFWWCTISGEFLFENRNYALCKVLYRQPKGQIESFEKNLKETFSQIKNLKKQFHFAGDLNLIVFDHEICKKVQQFLNIIYENGMIPIIKKPIRVTNKTAIVIGHILEKFLTYDH